MPNYLQQLALLTPAPGAIPAPGPLLSRASPPAKVSEGAPEAASVEAAAAQSRRRTN